MKVFDRRRTPARADLAAAHLAGEVEAARFVEGVEMRVAEEAIDLRERPGFDCSLDTQVLFGDVVTVYEVHEGWAWGQVASDGYVGYVPAAALDPRPMTTTHFVNVPRTFVYPVPNMKAPVNHALPLGARVTVAVEQGCFAQLAEGGFVWLGHLAGKSDVARDYVAVAENFHGAPYLWGGKTWQGIDCSGLVQVALAAAGVAAPRDTDMMQAEVGEVVPPGDPMKRGDLVFWKGHVGILQNATTLLHANGHHMQVASETFEEAKTRIAANSFGDIVCVRRVG